jgi:hypothetical protein
MSFDPNHLPDWFQSALSGDHLSKGVPDCVRELEKICQGMSIRPVSATLLEEVSREKAISFLLQNCRNDLVGEEYDVIELFNQTTARENFFLGANFIAISGEHSGLRFVTFNDRRIDTLWSNVPPLILNHTPLFMMHTVFGNIATVDDQMHFISIIDGDPGW